MLDEDPVVGELTDFEESDDGFWGDESRGLEEEELTDIGVLAAADWLNSAASWDLVMQMGLGSSAFSVMQSSCVVSFKRCASPIENDDRRIAGATGETAAVAGLLAIKA